MKTIRKARKMSKVEAKIKAHVKALKTPAAPVLVAAVPVPVPVVVPPVAASIVASKATEIYQGRGGRMWFQMAVDLDGKIRVRAEILRAKLGLRTMNDMAAMMFEALCEKHGV